MFRQKYVLGVSFESTLAQNGHIPCCLIQSRVTGCYNGKLRCDRSNTAKNNTVAENKTRRMHGEKTDCVN